VYASGDEWPQEIKRADGVPARILYADVQDGYMFWRARRYGKGDGGIVEARGMGWGKVFTDDELEKVQKDLGINSSFVGLDSGGHRTAEVYQWCLKRANWKQDNYGRQVWAGGWKATKGEEGKDHFTKDGVRLLFLRSEVDPYIGKQGAGRIIIPLYLYADFGMQELLEMYIRGKVPGWTVETDAGDEYARQLWAEKRADPKTGKVQWHERKANHLRDCEKGCLLVALASGILRA
jgi:hypothetical protein